MYLQVDEEKYCPKDGPFVQANVDDNGRYREGTSCGDAMRRCRRAPSYYREIPTLMAMVVIVRVLHAAVDRRAPSYYRAILHEDQMCSGHVAISL